MGIDKKSWGLLLKKIKHSSEESIVNWDLKYFMWAQMNGPRSSKGLEKEGSLTAVSKSCNSEVSFSKFDTQSLSQKWSTAMQTLLRRGMVSQLGYTVPIPIGPESKKMTTSLNFICLKVIISSHFCSLIWSRYFTIHPRPNV